jgi:hypothetical protein
VTLGTLEDCVESAITGKPVGSALP